MQFNELILMKINLSDWFYFLLYSDFLKVILFCIIYLLLFIIIRWNFIAKPCRQHLLSQIEKLQTRIKHKKESYPEEDEGLLKKALSIAKLSTEKRGNELTSLWDRIFWSRGHEIAAWEIIHEFETQIPPKDSEVNAELIACRAELKTLKSPEAEEYLQQIDKMFPQKAESQVKIDPKAFLILVRKFLYNHYDSIFSQLVNFHNKSIWFVGIGLLFIMGLAFIFKGSEFFLLGAAGGFLSRLTRAQKTKNAITDYGTYWTTLFTSPITGAIGAWAGVLLIIWGYDAKILGSTMSQVSWQHPENVITMVVAFICGFSERIFDQLISKFETNLTNKNNEK